MNKILEDIIASEKAALENKKRVLPLERLSESANKISERRNFLAAISKKNSVNIIAEIKKASPSQGVMREDFKPEKIAGIYEESGASAISVLTEDTYFMGDLSYLSAVRKATSLPLLRKDFIFDPYQIFESLVSGADAVLLIAAIVDKGRLKDLISIASSLRLDCLVEVHSEEELKTALNTGAKIIGINNRDLNTFQVDIGTAIELIPKVPRGITVVVESGIRSVTDIKKFLKLGVNTFLIGETLMRSVDIARTMHDLTEV